MAAKRTNLEKLKEMYEKHKTSGYSSSFWYPSEEESIIRILPPIEEDGLFYKATGSHKFGDHFFWCPRLEARKRCAVCEETRKRYQSGTDLDKEIARAIKPKKKYLYNIINRKASDPTKVEIYLTGPKIWEKLMSYYFDNEYGSLDDVDKGYDFKLIRKVIDDYANYSDSRPMKNPSPLSGDPKEIAEILSDIKDLDACVTLEDYDVMKKALDAFLDEYYGEDKLEATKPTATEKTQPAKQPAIKEPKEEKVAEEESTADIDEFEAKLIKELADEEE